MAACFGNEWTFLGNASSLCAKITAVYQEPLTHHQKGKLKYSHGVQAHMNTNTIPLILKRVPLLLQKRQKKATSKVKKKKIGTGFCPEIGLNPNSYCDVLWQKCTTKTNKIRQR